MNVPIRCQHCGKPNDFEITLFAGGGGGGYNGPPQIWWRGKLMGLRARIVRFWHRLS